MLRIQTQVLNPRELQSRLNSSNNDRPNSLGSQALNEEIERNSIAVDMQTMKEMHDTLKD